MGNFFIYTQTYENGTKLHETSSIILVNNISFFWVLNNNQNAWIKLAEISKDTGDFPTK